MVFSWCDVGPLELIDNAVFWIPIDVFMLLLCGSCELSSMVRILARSTKETMKE